MSPLLSKERVRLKIPPFDELRVVSEVEPPAGSPYGLPSDGGEVLEDAFLNLLRESS